MLWAREILVSQLAVLMKPILYCVCYTSCVLHLTVLSGTCVVLCFHILSYMLLWCAWLIVLLTIGGSNMLCKLYRKCVTSCARANLVSVCLHECLGVCMGVCMCA